MKSSVKRILISGTGSGCGKTTVTCALLKALELSGRRAAAFKCGPDYIDPMFHREIFGSGGNLDLFLLSENTVKMLLARGGAGKDIAVIEGAMGLYDGIGGSDRTSANHVAEVTDTPVLLVVNVRGKALSAAAEISGYVNFGENKIRGVILNNCKKATYGFYKELIEEKARIKVCGFLPPVEEAELESRHLGLVTAAEIADLKEKLERLGREALESLDLDAVMEIAGCAPELHWDEEKPSGGAETPVKIGVARDKAFCFYYEDGLELLEEMGAELIPFSPLADGRLPDGISGLILGGGYPEEYLPELSQNTSMLHSIRQAAERGMPVFAECGGFMYLGSSVEKDGASYEMAGVLPQHTHMTAELVRFGYKLLTAKADNMLCRAGESVPCHEFHYSDSDNNGDSFTAERNGRKYDCIAAEGNVFAGYPHIHFRGNQRFAEGLVRACCDFGGVKWKLR